MYGSPPFIKFSEKYKWNVRTVRGTMGSGKFEFLHELIGAKTEDILHDKDANSLN